MAARIAAMRCTFFSCVRRISSALTVGWNGEIPAAGRQIHFAHETPRHSR